MSEFTKSYSEFIKHLIELFPDNSFLINIQNEESNIIMDRVKKLNDSIKTTTNFNYFLKNKIKLFSHKEADTLAISESLFGSELTLKKIFNNQEDTIKIILWQDLSKILLNYNEILLETNPNDKNVLDRISKLKTVDFGLNPRKGLNKILKTDNLNSATNEMINDIFGSFESTLKNPGENPFNNILQISNLINEKYKDKITNGEIDMNELLKTMTNIPGMENMGGIINSLTGQLSATQEQKETIVIDENFSTAIVPQGEQTTEPSNNLNIGALLNTVGSMTGGESGDLSKLMNVFGKLTSTNNPEEITTLFESELGLDMNKITQEMSKVLEEND